MAARVCIFYVDGPLGPPDGGGGLWCGRAPKYLRGVRGADGKLDALDQLDDAPADDEEVFVYRFESSGHICGRGRGQISGPMVMYRHITDVDTDGARDTEAWRIMARELDQLHEAGF